MIFYCARFFTRPPTGTPRRAISPCEGLLRPRVARAQKIIRLHPFLCSALSLVLAYPFKGGLVGPLMRASNAHACVMLPPSLLVSVSWKGTHVGLCAAVERGPS